MKQIKKIFNNEYVKTILMVLAIAIVVDWITMHFTVLVLDTSTETEEFLDIVKVCVFVLVMLTAIIKTRANIVFNGVKNGRN